jgi:hypothetical protein
LVIESIDGGGGGVDELDGGKMADILENGDKSLKVRRDVVIGVGKGMAHSGLCCEMNHMSDAVFQEEKAYEISIANVGLDNFYALFLKNFSSCFFEFGVVIGVEIVET